MGFAGNAPDKDQQAAALYKEQLAYRRQYGALPTGVDKDPNDPNAARNNQAFWTFQNEKGALGDSYIDPATGRAANSPPPTPDLTDELLQRTRTSFAQRLQMGNNRASSFTGTQLGGSSLSKPILGGY